MKTVLIAGAASYYADSITAVSQLLTSRPVPHYLIFDFMAEGTIARMARVMTSDPEQGYEGEFVSIHIAQNLAEIIATGAKLIANAGALNPAACARAVQRLLAERGAKLTVAYVEGDDLRAHEQALRRGGIREMFSGVPLPDSVESINAYLGAFPIAAALRKGADIVITGRCADSALALGALIHEFGWAADDWNRLAAGTLVGHLLECGCQVTGGTYTDWEDSPEWANIGFPVAEVAADGSCVISKPPDTGGVVSAGTVAEQLLYETGDPRAYIVPDVICDFSGVSLQELGPNRIGVSNARGRPATDTYKAVASCPVGWRGTYSQVIIGIDAARKGQRQGEALIERGRRLAAARGLGPITRGHVECIGAEAAYGPHARASQTREVFMRASLDHPRREAVELYCREALASTSGMAPGSTVVFNHSTIAISTLFMCLVPKASVPVSVIVNGQRTAMSVASGRPRQPDTTPAPVVPIAQMSAAEQREQAEVPLIELAWARSGEKGNLFNIAVIARRADYLPYIGRSLTAERVAERFAFLYPPYISPRVEVFSVPGCHALNFVLHDSMDGGLLVSPRVDNGAKGMAQQLLELTVSVPAAILG